jgi:hypothetical protein
MTHILTFLTHDHIVQVADRRLTWPNGELFDDDTNKAVFYCGRVAVAYSGVYQMEGKPTAEWIGSCMKDATQTEEAMYQVAERAERYLQKTNLKDKRLAVVATGWGTKDGTPPNREFLCVASNFSPGRGVGPWEVWTKVFDASGQLFVVGADLYPGERKRLFRLIKRAAERGVTIISVARFLHETIKSVAARNERVGKATIAHLLSRKAAEERNLLMVTPLTLNCHSFLYTSKEGRTDRFQAALTVMLSSCFRSYSNPCGVRFRVSLLRGLAGNVAEFSAKARSVLIPCGYGSPQKTRARE